MSEKRISPPDSPFHGFTADEVTAPGNSKVRIPLICRSRPRDDLFRIHFSSTKSYYNQCFLAFSKQILDSVSANDF